MEEHPHEPTPHRREQARREGQFAISRDLGTVIVVASGIITLRMTYLTIVARWTAVLETSLSESVPPAVGAVDSWFAKVTETATSLFVAVLPVLFVPVTVAVLLTFFQTGFWWSITPLIPRVGRLWRGGHGGDSDDGGGKGERLARCCQATLYLATVAVALFVTLPTVAGAETGEAMLHAAIAAITVMVAVVGLVTLMDYMLVRRRHERQLRMTPQQLREEQRELQGDPQTAARRQRLRSDMTQREIESIARRGDIVVTANDGTAILIRHISQGPHSPQILDSALGRRGGILASKARVRGATIVSNPELAAKLIHTTRPGDAVPIALNRDVIRLFTGE